MSEQSTASGSTELVINWKARVVAKLPYVDAGRWLNLVHDTTLLLTITNYAAYFSTGICDRCFGVRYNYNIIIIMRTVSFAAR